jgi:hypothetical protein
MITLLTVAHDQASLSAMATSPAAQAAISQDVVERTETCTQAVSRPQVSSPSLRRLIRQGQYQAGRSEGTIRPCLEVPRVRRKALLTVVKTLRSWR